MNRIQYIFYILLLAVCAACTEVLDVPADDDYPINAGDKILFGAHVPQVTTKAAAYDDEDAYWTHINKFDRVQDDYVFDVEMWEKGDGDAVKIAQASYNPIKDIVDEVITYDEYGTLTEAGDVMYWPSNVKKYGFHAVSSNSSNDIEADQTTLDNFFRQDRIEGYGYVPGWDDDLNDGAGAPIRDLDDYNFLTNKQWYAANRAWGTPVDKNGDPLVGAQLVEHWKKIPLFMRHKRSRITVLLKAGEGVERDQIAYDPDLNPENIHIDVFSYDADDNVTTVRPMLGSYDCQYRTPDALPEEDVTTACYDAIVNPHDYADGTNMTEQKILAINLSGMKFSFYAANDREYSSDPEAENTDVKTRYNLTEGKHLILQVTLSTDTRKILITAYVVDWEDWPFSSICDDFGQASDPMPINNKAELIDFLTDPEKNKGGNVGVIMPLEFNLNSEGGWDPSDYELKATLKLAGATIITNQRLFDKIAASGSLVNGTVEIADRTNSEAPLECAIANENYGTIERINIKMGDTSRKATRAGLVTTNYGTIYACTSQLPVYNAGGGSEVLIGGIAAEMRYPMKDEGGYPVPDLSVLPAIDQCNVNARIDGGENVKGGGIAGLAEGKLSNNTYEYGITMSQDVDRFKNILYEKGSQELQIYDNEWSTRAGNTVLNGTTLTNFRPDAELYNQVLDSQEELRTLITQGTYNNNSSRFRIANSFSVDGYTWDLGIQNLDKSDSRNLLCELNGSNKTITLTGSTNAQMLFSNIQSHVYDLTLKLDKPIEALPDPSAELEIDRLTARAPLAYALIGNRARLTNVNITSSDGAYVKSTASGGLVVWAYDEAIIEDCSSDVDVRIAMPDGSASQQTYFVGGLVCTAAKATIQRCTYLRDNLNSTEEGNATPESNIYYGGIVGGTNSKSEATYHPELNISDCVSWLIWDTSDNAYPHAAWGGIIGYSKYASPLSPDVLITAMDSQCQGNWWAAPVGASAKGWASGMTEEKVIGKKNSVRPTKQ